MSGDGEVGLGAPAGVESAAAFLRERVPWEPEILMVLGSGLGGLAGSVEDPVEIPFGEVPGYPAAGVAGHAGRYLAGMLEGRRVLVQAGRFHRYEGHLWGTVGAPVRVARRLGASLLVVTNAAGGLDRRLPPGSLMLLDDHINLMWEGPLSGPLHAGEERFPDMSAPYDRELQSRALNIAAALGIWLHRGTYVGVTGPSYETPAEVGMLARMGAHAVGMSTVPEVVTARALGMRVLGFSLITNPGAGLVPGTLDHHEVLEAGAAAAGTLERLLRGILSRGDGGE